MAVAGLVEEGVVEVSTVSSSLSLSTLSYEAFTDDPEYDRSFRAEFKAAMAAAGDSFNASSQRFPSTTEGEPGHFSNIVEPHIRYISMYLNITYTFFDRFTLYQIKWLYFYGQPLNFFGGW